MPKTTKQGQAKKNELPSTLKKSSAKAQRTYTKTYDSAMSTYGDEERAHRVANAALKHSYEKVGDHWEQKEHRGPSDERSHSGGPNARGTTAEGVNAEATKEHLLTIARRLDVRGRSTMNKGELVKAIEKANRRASRKS